MTEYLTKKQASKYLTLSISTIENLIRAKAIPHFKVGRRVVFKKADLDDWLEKKRKV